MGNQHSVSQFLTRPWERRPDRKLVYFDFETDAVAEAKSKELFARHDVHSEEIDRRFRDLIEDPLARLWHRMKKDGVKEVTDRREIRAAHLIFLAQPARIVDHAESTPTGDRKLDELLGMSDAHLEMLIGMQVDAYDLRLFSTPKNESNPNETASLFYPQTGVIGFPVLTDPEKGLASVTAGAGIPLHPKLMLTIVPKPAHKPWLTTLRDSLQAFSVGLTDDCRKVVIPATIADRFDHGELAMRIKSLRAAGKEMVQLMVRMKELIGRAHRTPDWCHSGLPAECGGATS